MYTHHGRRRLWVYLTTGRRDTHVRQPMWHTSGWNTGLAGGVRHSLSHRVVRRHTRVRLHGSRMGLESRAHAGHHFRWLSRPTRASRGNAPCSEGLRWEGVVCAPIIAFLDLAGGILARTEDSPSGGEYGSRVEIDASAVSTLSARREGRLGACTLAASRAPTLSSGSSYRFVVSGTSQRSQLARRLNEYSRGRRSIASTAAFFFRGATRRVRRRRLCVCRRRAQQYGFPRS